MSADIKLFVCCHKYENVPEHPLLVPIQVGAALAEQHFDGFLHDDTGENISTKNRSYCELTAQYWAWKNVDADYYGFFHYRRYLYPALNAKLPYVLKRTVSIDSFGFDSFYELIEKYDLICPKAEDMHLTVREQYVMSKPHVALDLELAEQILIEQHPEMQQAAETYFSGTKQYFGNIYIMNSHIFHEYCQWLFPILEEFEKRCDMTGRSAQELRAPGYIAERLFGVFYTHKRDDLKCLELPRIHFESDVHLLAKKCMINTLLPPGSRRRALFKERLSR